LWRTTTVQNGYQTSMGIFKGQSKQHSYNLTVSLGLKSVGDVKVLYKTKLYGICYLGLTIDAKQMSFCRDLSKEYSSKFYFQIVQCLQIIFFPQWSMINLFYTGSHFRFPLRIKQNKKHKRDHTMLIHVRFWFSQIHSYGFWENNYFYSQCALC
jgi:hypothetical protein